ncbi:DUF4132 domain-containing protein [Paraflavisolibacter sp. H34]|uniref:DUF4132 domain-containing protein n=1 Tax=Huijunlia imazamoxiresistens TaxID=3127457 RepID=UPI00301B0CBF
MDSLHTSLPGSETASAPPPNHTPAIRQRLDTVAAKLLERHQLPFHPGFYQNQPSPGNKEALYLHTGDIRGKEDLLYLSALLPGLKEQNDLDAEIRIDVITSLFQYVQLEEMDLTEEELYRFLYSWRQVTNDSRFSYVVHKALGLVLKRMDEKGMTDEIKEILMLFLIPDDGYLPSEARKINGTVEFLLQGAVSVAVNMYDPWGKKIISFLEALPDSEKAAWKALLNHCLAAGEKGSPVKKWLEKAQQLVAATGRAAFSTQLAEWLSFNRDILLAIHRNEQEGFLREGNHNLLKSLIWCAGLVNDAALNTAVDHYAALAYKKKPGQGPVSLKTGNACMFAFSMLPFKEAVTRLMKFRNRTTNNAIIKSIDKLIGEVAEKSGRDKDVLEEIGVMDFGLNKHGCRQVTFDNVTATLQAKAAGDVSLTWTKEGKELKSVPAAVKATHGAALKELKNEATEMAAQLQVQKDRIESYYLRAKSWPYSEWQELYLQHPLVRIVAGRLIWSFTHNGQTQSGFFEQGRLVNAAGAPITDLPEETKVELWHPIQAATEEIVAWRNFIQEREITQPFKQAYREIYLLTDAELRTNTYSNRFAAHVLRQHQFAALCRQRQWKYHLMGSWDSHNTPVFLLPHWNMMAQYYVEADWNGATNEMGIFLYIATDQVRFYRDGEQLELADVPRLVFSEVMRDVDLFVGVTSIGNDPDWSDAGDSQFGNYWRSYSFGDLGESAKVRKEVLQRLVPRLKIRDKCSFDGKFLVVRGQIRTYKIHMGSGNILMEPNDQYLCIVPAGKKERDQKMYLPFEGDNLLSIIISKALLLAEDDKIKDETITRQLK